MNKTEIAEKLGVTRKTVYEWGNNGTLKLKMDELGLKEDSDLDSLMAELEKKYGQGIFLRNGRFLPCELIPSGIEALDEIIGGIAKGKVINFWGTSGSGKTTLGLTLASKFLKYGHVSYIDTEHAVDYDYAKALGASEVNFSQPDTLEDALELIIALLKNGGFSMIVLDSVGASAIRPNKSDEDDDTIGKADMGRKAKVMTMGLAKIVPLLSQTNCTLILINRCYDSMQYHNSKAPPVYRQPGGTSMEFSASQMFSMMKISDVLNTNREKRRVRVTYLKSRVNMPFKSRVLAIEYGKGFKKDYHDKEDEKPVQGDLDGEKS